MHNPVLALALNLLLGAALGAAGGLLGIGGGLIAIPALAWLYGMDQHLAQGTALVMIIPNVLVGFVHYRQRNPIDLRATASLAAVAVVSAWVAAHAAVALDAHMLRLAFAVFLLALAGYFAWQLRAAAGGRPGKAAVAPRFLPLLGLLSGLTSGLFSVGGGLVVVPALVTLFRMTQTQAQGIALALALPGSLVALFAYAQQGHVAWAVGIPLALAGVVSVSAGVALAHGIPQRRLRGLFCLVLVGTALLTLAQK